MSQTVFSISAWVLPILLAVTLHEAAHGWVAWKLGDDTARSLGRVTFNPLKHIDPYGTVIVPAVLLLTFSGSVFLGWAKPVPVNFRVFRHPRRDMILVALAGPLINLAMAAAAVAAIYALPLISGPAQAWIGRNLQNLIWFNLILFLFNMLPVPPLDGGRVAVGILPVRLGAQLARLERWGIGLILFIFFVPAWIGNYFGVDLNVFGWLIGRPLQGMLDAINLLLGG